MKERDPVAFPVMRALLMSLLADMSSEPSPPVVDLEGMADQDKWSLLCMSAAEMIVEVLWVTSGGDCAEAQRGFDALAHDIRARIDEAGEESTLQ